MQNLNRQITKINRIMKNTKQSKRRNAFKEAVRTSVQRNDMISNMPDTILHLILSCLPTTEEAVRTSVLSRRWRYLWTSLPSIDLDCSRRQTNFKKNAFKEFVYWVLVNKTLDLDTFRLCCLNYYNMSTVGRWIHAAVIRKVKSLDLTFFPRVDDEVRVNDEVRVIRLPCSLVTCNSLEVLRLFLFSVPLSLPTASCFPALRVLELKGVQLSDSELVRQFLRNCPLLEDLSLVECTLSLIDDLSISCLHLKTLKIDNRRMCFYKDESLCDRLQISCPKLVFLEYVGHTADAFSFENLGSLKKAVIYPYALEGKSFESYGDTVCQLFYGVSHVESLSLNLFSIQAISAAPDPVGDFPASLSNLKTLEISTTIDNYTMSVVIRILRCSPNLESLHLIIEEEILGPEVWKLDEVLTRHLKRVKFLEFNGEKQKLDMARFLLEHGNVLEEMVFIWFDEVSYQEKSTATMEEILKFDKQASSTVKLTTLLKDYVF